MKWRGTTELPENFSLFEIWAIDRSVENYDVASFSCVSRGMVDDVEPHCWVPDYRSTRTTFSFYDYPDVRVGEVDKRGCGAQRHSGLLRTGIFAPPKEVPIPAFTLDQLALLRGPIRPHPRTPPTDWVTVLDDIE